MNYQNENFISEGTICLFDSHNYSVEQIAKFTNYLWPWEVATTKNKVNSYIRYFEQFFIFQIFGINEYSKSFEIYDLNTRQISRGLINKSMSDRFREFYRSRSS